MPKIYQIWLQLVFLYEWRGGGCPKFTLIIPDVVWHTGMFSQNMCHGAGIISNYSKVCWHGGGYGRDHIMCASFTQYKKSLHPGFVVPTISHHSEICRFWCLNNQCATLHHQHIASHQLRITAQGPSRHGIGSHPAVIHPQPTLQAEELHRRALTGREDQLGPVHPDTLSSVRNLAILLEVKGSVAEARGVSVESTCVAAWGGSAWRGCQGGKLVEVEEDKKWFNSDAFLKGDLSSLGKSVVKIRKMMFYSVFFL